jgi:hypothetical protein
MDLGISWIATLVVAEGQLRLPPGSSGESNETLMQVINDAMTSWWAQAIAIGMYAAIAFLLYRSLRRQDDGSGPPVERRKARNVALGVLVALAALVVSAAALRPGPLVFVEYVILFTVLAYLMIRNVAPAVLGAGDAIMWAFSPRRRREMREAARAQEGARERGSALEQTLDGALGDARRAAETPRGIAAPPYG